MCSIGNKWFFRHSWSEWKKSYQTNITRSKDEAIVGYQWIYIRECERCKKPQHLTERVWV